MANLQRCDSLNETEAAEVLQKGGDVKPNIGHSEGASGISSIVKAALALKHNVIPPNINFNTPNTNISWEEEKLQVPLEATSWPTDRKQRVSVNSIGIGGANAHAVLDSAVACEVSERNGAMGCAGPQLLVLSAKSEASLQRRIYDVTDYANAHLESLSDIIYTPALRREHLEHRAFAIVHPNAQVEASAFSKSHSKSSEAIFVFTGQGSQWPSMGRDLIKEFRGA